MFEKIRNLFNKKEENSSGRKVPDEVNDPDSIYYVDPKKYGVKPGVVTWEYLNALYDMTERYEQDQEK